MTNEKVQTVYDFIQSVWGDTKHARRLTEVWSKESDEQIEKMYESILCYKKSRKEAQPVINEIFEEAKKHGPLTSEEIRRFLAGHS